jgi:membrane-associated phospholipid phosphatase
MRFRHGALAATIAAMVPMAAQGQSVGKMIESDVRNGVGDMVAVWATPLHARGRDWLTAAGAIAVSAALMPIDDNVDRSLFSQRNDNGWSFLHEFREGGAAFSGRTITPIAVGVYIIGLATKSVPLRDGVWGCAASYASSSIVRNYVFYEAIGRVRPDSFRHHDPTPTPAASGDQYKFSTFPGSKWGRHSLPAGHVANVMACASYLGNRFDMGMAEPLPYLVAIGVGFGRILDRRHWTSDTVLGAIFGYAVGKEVALRSLRRRSGSQPGSSDGASDGPLLGTYAGAVSVGWQWSF